MENKTNGANLKENNYEVLTSKELQEVFGGGYYKRIIVNGKLVYVYVETANS